MKVLLSLMVGAVVLVAMIGLMIRLLPARNEAGEMDDWR